MLLFISGGLDSTALLHSFNTSHVTLYQTLDTEDSRNILRFNTSHVTLYPLRTSTCLRLMLVSIHLMLLFIGKKWAVCGDSFTFQYISCYSLSDSRRTTPVYHLVSIHLMLLFINEYWEVRKGCIYVSIHLMLLFIGVPTMQIEIPELCFNTSHVTLYLCSHLSTACIFPCFNTSHVTLYR